MSLNKVLNRPMFRQKALKKGVLKTINAQTGIMVGSPTTPAPVPALRKPPTFFERMRVSGPARFLASGISIPAVGGYIAGETVAKGLGIEDPIGKTAAGIGGSILATKALPGLASLPAATSLALMAGPAYLTYAGSKELERIKNMTPEERAAHREKSKQFGMSYLDDEQFNKQFTPRLDDIVKSNEDIKEEVKISKNANPGSGLSGSRGGKKSSQTDRLTETDNESDVVQGNVDINKVVQNNDPNKSPVTIGAEDTVTEKSFIEKPKMDTETKIASEVKTDEKANENVIKAGSNDLDKPGKIKAADGTEVNNEVITLARQYRKELMAGQKSQAKLVFLANLASGLMSGTTTKGGLGGALEVFGKALGPAVNNYATVKLKENELSNEFMSDALELASDEIDRANQIIEAPPVEGDPGMIQFTDKNGNLVNMRGIQAKDGTVLVARPGQLNQFGRNNYVPLAPGQFNRFVKSSELDPKALDTLMELDQKYKAYQYGQKSVALIERFVEQGKTGAGPIGRFNLFKGRVSEALFDLTGREMFTNEDEAREKANEYRDLLIDDWLRSNEVKGKNDEEKRKNAGETIDKILGDSVNKDKIMSAIGEFTGEADQQALSQLAINETVMVYALANSLKSKDRLTAKDIAMAKDLVNIFPLLRGQKAVIRDLKSVNATILQDISSLENTYTTALMGETETLKQYKQKYGLATSEAFMAPQQLQPLFEDKSTNELLEMY